MTYSNIKNHNTLGLCYDTCTSTEFLSLFSGKIIDGVNKQTIGKQSLATPYTLSIYGEEMYSNCPFKNGNGEEMYSNCPFKNGNGEEMHSNSPLKNGNGEEMYSNCPFKNGNGYGDGRAISLAVSNIAQNLSDNFNTNKHYIGTITNRNSKIKCIKFKLKSKLLMKMNSFSHYLLVKMVLLRRSFLMKKAGINLLLRWKNI
jgi:hypothetical protein